MVNYRLIFALLCLVLIFSTGTLFILYTSSSATLDSANSMSGAALDYLDLIDHRCRTRAGDYDGIEECFEELNRELERVSELEEEDFDNADPEDNETGYLILVNEGRQSLDSSGFTLLLNRNVVDEGCVIQGAIDPGYACRLNFESRCEKGDVLEVIYEDTSAYLKTC